MVSYSLLIRKYRWSCGSQTSAIWKTGAWHCLYALALLLAGFGVYGMAAYAVQRRTREIVLRKVSGAGPSAIAGLQFAEFRWTMGLGLISGVVLSWLLSQLYLENFVERADFRLFPQILALCVVVLVSALTILRQVWIALKLQPVRAFQS